MENITTDIIMNIYAMDDTPLEENNRKFQKHLDQIRQLPFLEINGSNINVQATEEEYEEVIAQIVGALKSQNLHVEFTKAEI